MYQGKRAVCEAVSIYQACFHLSAWLRAGVLLYPAETSWRIPSAGDQTRIVKAFDHFADLTMYVMKPGQES
jgi:hypothetical protein